MKQLWSQYNSCDKSNLQQANQLLDTIDDNINHAKNKCGGDTNQLNTYNKIAQAILNERGKLISINHNQQTINPDSNVSNTVHIDPPVSTNVTQSIPTVVQTSSTPSIPVDSPPSCVASIFTKPIVGTRSLPIDITSIQSDDTLLAQHSAAFANKKQINDVLKPITSKSANAQYNNRSIQCDSDNTANDSRSKSSHPLKTINVDDKSNVTQNNSKRTRYNISDDDSNDEPAKPSFMSASDKYAIDLAKKNNNNMNDTGIKRLGRTGIHKFRSPVINNNTNNNNQSDSIDHMNVPSFVKKALKHDSSDRSNNSNELPERLKGCDPKLVEMIKNDMMEQTECMLN